MVKREAYGDTYRQKELKEGGNESLFQMTLYVNGLR
jgi:hypothetical protein